eukprot:SAG11_NODE_10149_length_851_cov_1.232713_2_plen_76_part_01
MADAAAYMALALTEGRGCEVDLKAAERWRRQAAAQGDVKSCRSLSAKFPRDPLVASWRLVLAEHGEVDSQYYIGWC